MPSKRDVLVHLTRDELLAAVDRFALSPPDRRAKDGIIETVALSKKATLPAVPELVNLRRLNHAMIALSNFFSGARSELARRIEYNAVESRYYQEE